MVELFEVGELLQRTRRVADAEPLLAGHPITSRPVEVGAPSPQLVRQLTHSGGQIEVGKGAVHQLAEFGPLSGGEAVHQPLGSGSTPRQRVDELVEICGLVGEHVAEPVHERIEVRLGVLTFRVVRQHRVQFREHVFDALQRRWVRVLQGRLHSLELAV